ncbi:hypothetical protein H0H92_011554, partial [Tricholoma furcatifolium]
RNRQERDPPRTHPRTVFIPEDDVEKMEKYVEGLRTTASRSRNKRQRPMPTSTAADDDHYEGTLRVPKSVLDGCESGFTAADSRRQKASTQFFDDTALMALLCRHDIVLFIANMRSMGEKQHYVVVLVETLFQHLPLTFTIGLLYDIGCQLERSCVKWGFLDRYMDRLTFGISVFHAFGHQWPCQLIYHPRKRTGFGLSDGEGSYLRYHQRLYTLDRQVDHAQAEILNNLGLWLLRRSRHTEQKLEDANSILQHCEYSKEYLREQWKLQIQAQTKPLPRQSRTAGKDAVGELIRLRDTRDALKLQEREHNKVLVNSATEPDMHADTIEELKDIHLKLEATAAAIQRKSELLGVRDRARLTKLTNDPFYAARVNALAVKTRLRDRLRARKFEMERVERSFRKQ